MMKTIAAQALLLFLLSGPTHCAEPNHFVAVHGRKAVIMGYPRDGLEIWGYPFQILSNYQIGLKPVGTAVAVDGRQLLRRVDYSADSVTRTYVGPDYLVREKLFVPLEQAAAVIRYEVEGIRPVEIEIRFMPVLNLMWPAALGGQYTRWSDPSKQFELSGFVISEPLRGFSAAIGTREAVSHSDTVNSTVIPQRGVSFLVRPTAHPESKSSSATVYVAINTPGTAQPFEVLDKLREHAPQLEAEAATHYRELEKTSLLIRTPDEEMNNVIAATVTALDQAWVCNEMLGCGIVAGYGPSRDARRPQYAWFFGGDGLVATNALVSTGQYSRARDEIRFVQKYQDAASGMIWHELSQSAGFIDWSKFPYMYVHVDISFDYLVTLARYVIASGDMKFAKEGWDSALAAYRYCLSQINSDDHLPHIPGDKEASDEQHRPADDLSLAASWMAAASGFAELANMTGHAELAAEALEQSRLTRQSIPVRYWNAEKKFWFDGHTQSGEPIFRDAAGPTQLLVQSVFTAEQNENLLARLASADFQADWGLREVAASAQDYNPYSYGAGSISALGTSALATTLWQAHRPESAWGLWNAVAHWGTLDSPGHIHEVLAGNFFHEQTESVPEQTWSSAGFLDATVRGLFGLEVDGGTNQVRFAPHLPAEWREASVENIRLAHSTLGFQINQSMNELAIKVNNDGIDTTVLFEPQIPLGAELLRAEFNGRKVASKVAFFGSDEHATVTLSVPPGMSLLSISFKGGISFLVGHSALQVGDSSSDLKIVKVNFNSHVLTVEADVKQDGGNKMNVLTPWLVTAIEGATTHTLSSNLHEVSIKQSGDLLFITPGYRRHRIKLRFSY